MPKRADHHLAEGIEHALSGIILNGTIGRGRAVGGDVQGAEHQFNTVEVKAVANRDTRAGVALAQDFRDGHDAFVSRIAASLGEDFRFRQW